MSDDKTSDSDSLIDGLDFGVGATSIHGLEDFTDLIFWIESNRNHLPIKDLLSRGYISEDTQDVDALNILGSSIGQGGKLFRAGNLQENDKRSALINTWVSLVGNIAEKRTANPFEKASFTKKWLLDFVKISQNPNKITELSSVLAEIGIILVIEPSFEGLGIDGVVSVNNNGNPVIGHSVRFDRLDNFWFTLLHELSHIYLHYDSISTPIIEDFESHGEDVVAIEKEADYFATNLVVPNSVWRRCDVIRKQTAKSVTALAKQLDIHPALIAGKFRYEKNRFEMFSDMVNEVSVRRILGV